MRRTTQVRYICSASRKVALTLGLLACMLMSGQAANAQARPCVEGVVDPLSVSNNGPVRLLQRYYVGGSGCWIHDHPNGSDHVVTPFRWGANPNPSRQMIIREIIKTISTARENFVVLGSLHDHLFVIADGIHGFDGDRRGQMWDVDDSDECWVQLKLGTPINNRRTLAHEIGHCFISKALDLDVFQLREGDFWWSESAAEYYSTIVYPGLDHEHAYATDFSLDEEFTQPYRAHVLFAYFSEIFGPESVVEILGKLEPLHSPRDAVKLFSQEDLQKFVHDFFITHYQGKIVDNGGGNMPRPSPIIVDHDNEYVDPETLPSTNGFITVEKVKGAKLTAVRITIPSGHQVSLIPPNLQTLLVPSRISVSLEIGDSVSNGRMVLDWTEAEVMESSCDADQEVTILISHLEARELPLLKFGFKSGTNPECNACVPPNKIVRKYGPKSKYVKDTKKYVSSKNRNAVCQLSCEFVCQCASQHRWENNIGLDYEQCREWHSMAGHIIKGHEVEFCKAYTENGRMVQTPYDMLERECSTKCREECR